MADFILRLGVEFRPRDVNARAIRQQIAKAIGAARVSIERVTFSREARDRLKRSFMGIAFQVDKARFTTQARRSLQASFGNISFAVQRANFGRSGRSDLQASFRRIPFTVGSVQVSANAIRQLQGRLSTVQVGGAAGGGTGDALAAQARRQFEARQAPRPPATISSGDFQNLQISPDRIRSIAQEFTNLGNATERLRSVSQQVRGFRELGQSLTGTSETIGSIRQQVQGLGNLGQPFAFAAQRTATLSTNLRQTAAQLSAVQARAGQTRAALEQMQVARRAQEMRSLAEANLRNVQATDPNTRTMRQLTSALNQSGTSAEVFGARLGQIISRFTQYLVAVRALIAAQQLFSASLNSIVEFDSVIQNLNQVLNTTPQRLQEVSQGLFDVAEQSARSFGEVAEAVGIFVRAGDTIPQALEKARAALIATNISELQAADATRLITSALQVFRDELEDPIEFLDKLSVTADNAATTAGAVGQAFLRSASAARESGVGFEQLLGLIAATLEETQLQAGTVGTALKTIFTRAVSNAEELREVGNQFGANIRAGDDLITVLGKLSAVFDETSIAQRNQIGLLVGGRRQFNIFAGILNNFAASQELVERQSDSTGVALRKNEETLQTLAAQGRQVVATFDELVNTLAGTTAGADGAGRLRGILSDVLTTTNEILRGVTDLIQRFSQAGGVVGTITSALRGAVATGLLAVGGRLISGLVSGFRQFLQIGGLITAVLERIGGATSRLRNEEAQVTTELQRQLTLRERLLQVGRQPASQVIGNATDAVRGARAGAGPAGLLSRSVERLRSGVDRFVDTVRNPGRAFGNARRGVNNFFNNEDPAVSGRRRLAGITALGAVASVAGGQLDKFATSLSSSSEASDQLAGAGVKAASSALQLGVTFGALTGSIKFGLLAGLVAASAGVLRYVKSLERNAETAREFQNAVASAGNFTAGELRQGFGGDILREAVENVAGPLSEFDDTQIFNLENIILRSGNLLEQANNDLTSAVNLSKDAIDDFSETISGFAGAAEFRRNIADAQQRNNVSEIQGQFELSGLNELSDITDPLSRALAISNEITRGLNRGATEAERLQQAFQAGTDILESQSSTIGEIIDDYRLETETRAATNLEASRLTSELQRSQNQLQAIVDDQAEFDAALERSVRRVRELESEARRVAEAGGAPTDDGREDNISAELERQAQLQSQLQQRAQQRENIQKNIQTLIEQETEVRRIARQEDERIQAGLEEIQKAFIEIAGNAGEIVRESDRETRSILDQNQVLSEQAAIQRSLLDVEINRGSVAEQFLAQQEATQQQAINAVNRQIAQQQTNIDGLRSVADSLARTSPEVAQELNSAADKIEQSLAEQRTALLEQIDLQITPELERNAVEAIRRSEDQLSQVRVENINNVLAAEQRRFDQTQQLISGLDSFISDLNQRRAGGQNISTPAIRRLRTAIDDELEGISDRARQVFGDVGSILVRNTLQSFERIAARGAEILAEVANVRDPAQRARRAGEIQQEIIERNEEAIQFIRERILNELRASADRATTAEEALSEARNKAEEAADKVRSAEDALSQASDALTQAHQRVTSSIVAVREAQVDYNIAVINARNNVLSSTGAFRSFGEQVASLNEIATAASSIVISSEQRILEIRADIAQQALSIFQEQFNAIQSLGTRAATATLDDFTDIQTGLSAAQQVLAGNGGELSPELLQLASQFTDLFPGLERAISEIGLERLGVDPSVLEELQDRQLQLAEITADSAQAQVVQAEQQLAAANEALIEARERKEIAKEQLSSAQEQEARATENLEEARRNSSIAQAGFANQATLAQSQLQQLSGSFALGQRSLEVLNDSRNLQNEALAELQQLNATAREQLSRGSVSIANNASGSLSGAEINGLIAAAQREKRGMPPGSRLMLANTSETVLTRTQARSMGLRPIPKANAQDGNAASFGSMESMAVALNTAVNTLISRLDGAALVEQNIAVQIDSNRTVDVRGLETIEGALRQALQERFGTFASREEQAALAETIAGLITRLNEAQIVNTRGF